MAATERSAVPLWLINCKEKIIKTKEWETFVEDLHEVIQQQLRESHVQYFADLSTREKSFFVNKAVQLLSTGLSAQNSVKKISELLDFHLNSYIATSLLDDQYTLGRSDLILSHTEEATTSLLQRSPELLPKLQIFFNQPLPGPLKQLLWKMTFSDIKVRKTYLDTLERSPKNVVSNHDVEISRKCQQILNSQPTFSIFNSSLGSHYAMKSVLSYYSSVTKIQKPPDDHIYLLVIPFLLLHQSQLKSKEQVSNKVLADIVEQFLSFLSSRPSLLFNEPESKNEIKAFMNRVTEIINSLDSSLLPSMATKLKPTEEKETTQIDKVEIWKSSLEILSHKLCKCLFVGYLSTECLMFIWDQYVLGLGSPGFCTEFLAVVMATVMFLVKTELGKCESIDEVERTLAVECRELSATQFQFEVRKNHFEKLSQLISANQHWSLLSMDPTQGQPSWRHWSNEHSQSYTRPSERRRAREEREIERNRLLKQQRDAETAKREKEENERVKAEETRHKASVARKLAAENSLSEMEKELLEEKQKRLNYEMYADNEIARLEALLTEFQSRQTPSASSRLIIPPPPTRATPRDVLQTRVTPSRSDPSLSSVMIELLKRISDGVNKVANGEGDDNRILEEQSSKYFENYFSDLKQAQREVFGQELNSVEYERITPATKSEKSERVMKIMAELYRKRKSEL